MHGFHPKRAAWAALRLLRNRRNARASDELHGALAGRSWERLFGRWRTTHTGQTVAARRLRLRPQLLAAQENPDGWPEGSLGEAYSFWMLGQVEPTLEDFYDGLFYSVPNSNPSFDETKREFFVRERVAHGLWHVVTGHDRDDWGEVCLTFWAWVHHRNLGTIVPMILGALFSIGRWGELRREIRRAKAAAWLPGVLWEQMLPRPLAEVRLDLGIEIDDGN